jgi:hypothetical protein
MKDWLVHIWASTRTEPAENKTNQRKAESNVDIKEGEK